MCSQAFATLGLTKCFTCNSNCHAIKPCSTVPWLCLVSQVCIAVLPVCCHVLHSLPQALRLHRPQGVRTHSAENKAEVIGHLQKTQNKSGMAPLSSHSACRACGVGSPRHTLNKDQNSNPAQTITHMCSLWRVAAERQFDLANQVECHLSTYQLLPPRRAAHAVLGGFNPVLFSQLPVLLSFNSCSYTAHQQQTPILSRLRYPATHTSMQF